MVTSAAVPAVVATAIIGKQGFFVGATPSRLLTSANSGFVIIIPIAFDVSILDPPPIAMMKSAFAALHAATPLVTFSIVGFGLMFEYSS